MSAGFSIQADSRRMHNLEHVVRERSCRIASEPMGDRQRPTSGKAPDLYLVLSRLGMIKPHLIHEETTHDAQDQIFRLGTFPRQTG
jgi:hypothetical protein